MPLVRAAAADQKTDCLRSVWFSLTRGRASAGPATANAIPNPSHAASVSPKASQPANTAKAGLVAELMATTTNTATVGFDIE